MMILVGALFIFLFTGILHLLRMCNHLQDELRHFSDIANRAKTLCDRLVAGHERGADVAGLRRRVEAMERDIDEMDQRFKSLSAKLPPDIAKLNEHFKSRILVEQ